MIATLLTILVLQGSALADAQQSYELGLDALRREAFDEAENHLLEALEGGGQDPAVYHALGNALYRRQAYGRALAAWERGRRLNPRDGDLQANTQHTRRELGLSLTAPGDPPALSWHRWIAPWEGFLASSLLICTGLSSLLIRRIRPPRRGRRWGWEVPVSLVFGGILALSSWEADQRKPGHVVIDQSVMLRSALGSEGVAFFELSQGTALTVLEQRESHVLVLLEDGQKGWLPASATLSCDPDEPFSLR